MIVSVVDPSRTFSLRQRVLRPHQALEDIARDNEIPGAVTFGASTGMNSPILATATVYPEEPPESLSAIRALSQTHRPWRLRAVATEEAHRSQGLGKQVLDAIIEHITEDENAVLWCYARVTAQDFYAREGFHRFGEVFDVEMIGAHITMYRAIDRLVTD